MTPKPKYHGRVVKSLSVGGPNESHLDLTDREMDDLVYCSRSFTGHNIDENAADAVAAPVGDITKSDPNWTHE